MPVPGTPTSLVATAVSDTEVNLTWTRADDNDAAVLIERAPDSSGSPGTYTQVASLPSHSNVWIDTSLWPSTTYWWRVRCSNRDGNGSYSSADSEATSAATGTGAAPTSFTMTAVDKETIDFSWTDNNSGLGGRTYWVEMSFDGGFTYLPVSYGDSLTAYRYRPSRAGGNAIPLVPNTLYYGRVKCLANSGDWGPFAGPQSATTSTAAGVPVVPTGLDGGDPTDTQVILTWNAHPDPNATFKVERVEANVFNVPIWNQTYSQIGTPSAGATSYTDNTATEYKQYFYRIRAVNGSGDSPYTSPIVVRTPHAVRGGGAQTKRIDATGGEDYTTIAGAATWIDAMGPGDVLEIKGNGTTAYAERLMLPRRGRSAAPLTVRGIADGSGNLPIISGTSATTSSTFSVSFGDYETYSLIFIGTHSTNTTPGPGNILIENLVLRNAKNAGTFTGYLGGSKTWDLAASGIYIQKGDHITVRNCTIHGNGNGIFTGDHGDLNVYTEDVTVENCYLYDHGNSGSSTEHGLYLQGLRSIVQGNKIGPPLSGALGNNLKDRGPDTLIRYNKFADAPAAHLLDIVENQDGYPIYHFLPGYRISRVYGNSFACGETVSTLFHYGYDHANPQSGRKGILYFYHNTLIIRSSVAYAPGISVFSTGYTESKAWETVDARNNILASLHDGGGDPLAVELDLLPVFGVGSFGKNWVQTGWSSARSDQSFTGKAAQTGLFTTGSDPLVVNNTTDFHLTASSPARGIAGAIADVLPDGAVCRQYVEPASSTVRMSQADAGAFDEGVIYQSVWNMGSAQTPATVWHM